MIVTLAAGLGSGLLGTLVKISHDRQAEVRRQALETSQEFAARAPQWFGSLNDAITARLNDFAAYAEESGAAYEAARASLRDARGSLHRLLVALPQGSNAALKAIAVVHCLAEAIGELRVWPPSEREDSQVFDDGSEPLSEEDEDSYNLEVDEEPIDGAKMWRDFAERALGEFIYESAGELRAGLGVQVRRIGRRVLGGATWPSRALDRRRGARAESQRQAESAEQLEAIAATRRQTRERTVE